MMAAGAFLRFFIFTFIVVTHGYTLKGSQTTGQSGSGHAGVNYAAYHSGGPSLASAPYSAVGDVYGSTFGHGPSVYQPVVLASHFGGSGSSMPVGATGLSTSDTTGLSAMAGPGSSGVGGPGLSTLEDSSASLSAMGAPGFSTVGGQSVGVSPVFSGAGYVASPVVYEPAGGDAGNQNELPETQWTVPTTVFSEAGSSDSEYLGDILPPPPLAPQGPTLQSGETSSVVKEADLGNYQQQTEEFGYPADFSEAGPGFGQGLSQVLVPGVQLGGFRPAPSARFDRMLLYGLYPTGSYSTFSQNHEAGKDYSQDIHYLKEHVTESHGSGQQKKFFQGSL